MHTHLQSVPALPRAERDAVISSLLTVSSLCTCSAAHLPSALSCYAVTEIFIIRKSKDLIWSDLIYHKENKPISNNHIISIY